MITQADDAEHRILASWQANAQPWTDTVRAGRIESRRRVTDGAILAALRHRTPGTLLDAGCGEGWLSGAFAAAGSTVTGVDAVSALVDAAGARHGSRATFHVCDYACLAQAGLGRFDVAVFNFSLIGDTRTRAALASMRHMLSAGGEVLVQTLHPCTACGDASYRDGWREGSWAGCDGDFADPAPWYFRTLSGWLKVLHGCGLQLLSMEEPLHPDTGRPASLLLRAGLAG